MVNKPLYVHILEYLKDKIMSGDLLPEDQLPTEHQLAEQFNVSRITSKRALHELEREGLIYRKRGVGSFIKTKPDDGASKTESNAKDNSLDTNKIISMILPFDGAKGRLMDYIRGATEFLNAQGYFLSIHTTNLKRDQEKKLLTTLPYTGVKGIIYYPSAESNIEALHTLWLNQFPIITIDKNYDCIPISSVVSDNFSGGYTAAVHLLSLGHKRIAFLSPACIENTSSVRNRYFGYCRALADANIDIDSEIVAIGYVKEMNTEPGLFYRTLIQKLLQKGVTAVQADNDDTAALLLRGCLELGVRVPEDLSIVGFDDSESAAHAEILLTTVAQNFYEIGRKAAEIMVQILQKGERESVKVVLPVSLVGRRSSGAAKC